MFKLFLECFYFLSEIGSSKKAGGNVDGFMEGQSTKYCLGEKLNFFCETSTSKYFRLWGPCNLLHLLNSVEAGRKKAFILHKEIGMTMIKENFNYNNKHLELIHGLNYGFHLDEW